MPPPLKPISWSPSVAAVDTPALNSSVAAPAIVSVPLPVTAPLTSSVPEEASIVPVLITFDVTTPVPVPTVPSSRPWLVTDDDVRLASPASMIEPRLVQELVGSMVSDEFVPMSMTLDAVVVKVVGSMVTVSPLATSIAPLLVNVVGSIVSEPSLEAPVIVPLLVRELPLIWKEPLVPTA